MMRGEKAAANPWQANTLEWATDSPPPHENFRTMPISLPRPVRIQRAGRAQRLDSTERTTGADLSGLGGCGLNRGEGEGR